jgi:Ca-activated chloride channel homolog
MRSIQTIFSYRHIVTAVVLFCCLGKLSAQSYRDAIARGNELFEQEKYDEAEVAYRRAMKVRPGYEASFNLGNALYRQGRYDEAIEAYKESMSQSDNKKDRARALHNLGNTQAEKQKYKEAIESYKQALINNPRDEETRANLAYAMRQLMEPPPQDQDGKSDDNEDGDDENKEDKQQQDKGDDDKREGDKDDKQNEQEQDSPGEEEQEKPEPDPNFDPADAERIMQMIEDEEQKVQDKLKDQEKKKAREQPNKKSW